jgi:hypothetical protein
MGRFDCIYILIILKIFSISTPLYIEKILKQSCKIKGYLPSHYSLLFLLPYYIFSLFLSFCQIKWESGEGSKIYNIIYNIYLTGTHLSSKTKGAEVALFIIDKSVLLYWKMYQSIKKTCCICFWCVTPLSTIFQFHRIGQIHWLGTTSGLPQISGKLDHVNSTGNM